jgi:hypothetical protein
LFYPPTSPNGNISTEEVCNPHILHQYGVFGSFGFLGGRNERMVVEPDPIILPLLVVGSNPASLSLGFLGGLLRSEEFPDEW